MSTTFRRNILGVIFLIALAVLALLVYLSNRKPASLVPSPTPIATPLTTTSFEDDFRPAKDVNFSIMIGDTQVYFSNLVHQEPLIAFWKGYAFGREDDPDNPSIKLVKYDLNTGEKSTALELPVDYNDPFNVNNHVTVSSITAIEEKLIIILSGYLVESKVYLFTSPEAKPTLLPDFGMAYKIEKINNNYYVLGGFGDGCGGDTTYKLLDPNTLITRSIAESHSGCSEGDEIIGKYENYFLISEHRSFDEIDITNQTYINLRLQSMTNPEGSITLLNNSQMPKGVTKVEYDEKDKVLLSGDDLYSYDLSTRHLQLEGIVPDIFRYYPIKDYDSNYFCITSYKSGDNGATIPIYYLVAKSDGSYIDNNDCARKVQNELEPKVNQKVSELTNYLKALNLPPTFSLIIDGKRMVIN